MFDGTLGLFCAENKSGRRYGKTDGRPADELNVRSIEWNCKVASVEETDTIQSITFREMIRILRILTLLIGAVFSLNPFLGW